MCEVLSKILSDSESELKNCERLLELLQPEWDKFKARDGHNLYVSRMYADHFSRTRTLRKEIEALKKVVEVVTDV